MSETVWFLVVGGMMLARGLTATVLQNSLVTPAMLYLALGILLGPTVLNFFHFNPLQESALLEVLTEIVILISLFAAGVLLGAILAPTDPVLATDVQTRHPGDREPMRFTLTCEAGMNDGSAFPFMMLGLGLLGLHDLGEFSMRWVLVDVVWATAAGVSIGLLAGRMLARLAHRLRSLQGHDLMDNFLGLGLIGVVYGLSLLVDAWGFLAVFFAAVSLRQTEFRLAGLREDRCRAESTEGETEADVNTHPHDALPSVSDGSLIFKEQLERLSEMMLILLIGGTLFLDSWSLSAVGLALFLFLVVRPLSVFVGLLGTQTSWSVRAMVGWFGVRGIGSLYYLMYAIQHGLSEEISLELVSLTLIAVTLSIVVHGVSVKPLMARFMLHREA